MQQFLIHGKNNYDMYILVENKPQFLTTQNLKKKTVIFSHTTTHFKHPFRRKNVKFSNLSLVIVPVPTREEKCPVWAQVENKCTSDCD